MGHMVETLEVSEVEEQPYTRSTYSTSSPFFVSPIVSGAPPPSLWAIFIMPLHGIRHRQLRRQWPSSACPHKYVGSHCVNLSAYELLFFCTRQCVRCAHCCRVNNKFVPRGTSYADTWIRRLWRDGGGCGGFCGQLCGVIGILK
jgi:hypothetical protein